MTQPVLVQLNPHWRVSYDPLQWILQNRRGAAKWVGEAFCATRDALVRDVGERCGGVDQDALALLRSLPERRRLWSPEKGPIS